MQQATQGSRDMRVTRAGAGCAKMQAAQQQGDPVTKPPRLLVLLMLVLLMLVLQCHGSVPITLLKGGGAPVCFKLTEPGGGGAIPGMATPAAAAAAAAASAVGSSAAWGCTPGAACCAGSCSVHAERRQQQGERMQCAMGRPCMQGYTHVSQLLLCL